MLAEKETQFDLFAQELRSIVDTRLQRLLAHWQLNPTLMSALEYSLFPGGKRIRPLLALMLFHDLGGNFERLLAATLAIELIHTSTLIHDDLPAIDNDDMRRGKASVHKAYGEAAAILAGDILIPLAFSSINLADLPEIINLKLLESLSAAYCKVCHGQFIDILPRSGETTHIELRTLHELKTGALFQAAAEFAAIARGMSEMEALLLSRLGNCVGVYFQVVDDLIDAFGSDTQRGRAGSSDSRSHKKTFFTDASNEDPLNQPDILSAGEKYLNVFRNEVRDLLQQVEQSQNTTFDFTRQLVGQIDDIRSRIKITRN